MFSGAGLGGVDAISDSIDGRVIIVGGQAKRGQTSGIFTGYCDIFMLKTRDDGDEKPGNVIQASNRKAFWQQGPNQLTHIAEGNRAGRCKMNARKQNRGTEREEEQK